MTLKKWVNDPKIKTGHCPVFISGHGGQTLVAWAAKGALFQSKALPSPMEGGAEPAHPEWYLESP